MFPTSGIKDQRRPIKADLEALNIFFSPMAG
jgi:hypothetical protein